MTAQRYRTVLFDADNTLMDFDAAEEQALRRTMEARGLEFSRERLAIYVKINRELWDALHRGDVADGVSRSHRFLRFGRELGWAGDAEAWDREYLAALGDCGTLLPGALELLKKLRPHCRIGLATNGLQAVQRKRLAGNPIMDYLDGVFISQEMGVGKPHKEYFDAVLDTLGADKAATVMVGDDLLSDIQGAINAGIDSIWYSPSGRESSLPTYQVERLDQVADIVLGRETKR